MRGGMKSLVTFLFGALLVFLFSGVLLASNYNYVTPEEFKKWLETGKKVIIVDIQPHDDFVKHHFKGAIETNAYPADTDDLKKRLDKALSVINQSNAPVVIICPRGRKGAERSYDYLKSKGVDEKRLLILKGGVADFPYKELFVSGEK